MKETVLLSRQHVLNVIGANQDGFHELAVKALFLFGSVARDEATLESDVDFLVEFDRPVGLFTLLKLKLQDMLTEIAVVEKNIAGLTYETFAKNDQALRVVLYSLAVIGEAVANSNDALEAANPELPWQQIRGMRNMVIHEYFQLDLETVWETTLSDLPLLKSALQEILDNL